MNKISVTILTKDSARHLKQVMEACRSFDEVVVLDSGSSDATLEIARGFPNARIQSTRFKGFGPTHNEASGLARNDWILSLDSDEVISKELVQEIQSRELDNGSVYSFPMHNYFNGKWIRWCGWYPDRHIRLYHRGATRFSDAQVHERILCEGMKEVMLKEPVAHYSYDSISDFLTKMQRYSDLFAQQNAGKKSASIWKAIGHGAGGFIKSYFLKRGFMGGAEGFMISVYNGHVAFYKYMKLREANQRQSKCC